MYNISSQFISIIYHCCALQSLSPRSRTRQASHWHTSWSLEKDCERSLSKTEHFFSTLHCFMLLRRGWMLLIDPNELHILPNPCMTIEVKWRFYSASMSSSSSCSFSIEYTLAKADAIVFVTLVCASALYLQYHTPHRTVLASVSYTETILMLKSWAAKATNCTLF